MEDKIIKELVLIQRHDTETLEHVIEQFSPLLKKYARLLHYEEAFYDLQADFIELLITLNIGNLQHREDRYLITYFKNSVYHDYIKMSKHYKQSNHAHWLESEMSSDDIEYVDKQTATYDRYDSLLFKDLRSWLTETELAVIYLYYYLSFSVNEIACRQHITRQAVNTSKNRALYKIRAHLERS